MQEPAPFGVEPRLPDAGLDEHALAARALVGLAGHGLDDLAEQEKADIRVGVLGARRCGELELHDRGQQHVDCRLAQRALLQQLHRAGREPVVADGLRQPAPVSEQLRHRDAAQPLVAGITVLRKHRRQQLADRVVERELSLLDQDRDADAGDGLRHAPDGDALVDRTIAIACREHQAVPEHDGDAAAGNVVLGHPAAHGRVECGGGACLGGGVGRRRDAKEDLQRNDQCRHQPMTCPASPVPRQWHPQVGRPHGETSTAAGDIQCAKGTPPHACIPRAGDLPRAGSAPRTPAGAAFRGPTRGLK